MSCTVQGRIQDGDEDMQEEAYIVVDLMFGDSGKGHLVDFLCREHKVDLCVRFSGGPQCTHNVVLADGREHCFGSFGSGMFLPEMRTYISRHTLIDPFAIRNEAHALGLVGVKDAMDRLAVHPDCRIITPFCWEANRIKEILRGEARHGSCGMGLGECREVEEKYGLTLRVSDLGRPVQGILRALKNIVIDSVESLGARDIPAVQALYQAMLDENIDDLVDFYNEWARSVEIRESIPLSGQSVIFEGNQGVLLDEQFGFQPYTTWSDCTFSRALEICGEVDDLAPHRIGVLRTYATRHGAGPFPTEDPRYAWPDRNPNGPWQGPFRQGAFDLVAAKYALSCCGGADELCLTHLDRVGEVWEYCSAYRRSPAPGDPYNSFDERLMVEMLPGISAEELGRYKPLIKQRSGSRIAEFLEEQLGVPVRYRSYGPRAEDVKLAGHSARAGGV